MNNKKEFSGIDVKIIYSKKENYSKDKRIKSPKITNTSNKGDFYYELKRKNTN